MAFLAQARTWRTRGAFGAFGLDPTIPTSGWYIATLKPGETWPAAGIASDLGAFAWTPGPTPDYGQPTVGSYLGEGSYNYAQNVALTWLPAGTVIDSAAVQAAADAARKVAADAAAAAAAYAEAEVGSFHPDPIRDILVKGSVAPVYVVTVNGGRKWIPDKGTFEWLGYGLGNVRRISDAELASVPEEMSIAPHTPRLVKSGSSAKTYLVTMNGSKRWIPDESTFNVLELAWANIQTVSQAEIDSMPTGPNVDHLTEQTLGSAITGSLGTIFAAVGAVVSTYFTGDPKTGAAIGGSVGSAVQSGPANDASGWAHTQAPPAGVPIYPAAMPPTSDGSSNVLLYGAVAVAGIYLLSKKK